MALTVEQPLLLAVDFDWSAPRWECREVSRQTAEGWMGWHYLGTLPAWAYYCGLFCPDLICVVMVGLSINQSGMLRFGLRGHGNMEVQRVVAHPEAPKNTVSRSLRFAGRYLHEIHGLDWVYSYAETAQGHHGGIYQAVGAVYVGKTGGGGPSWRVDGRSIHARTMFHSHGTARTDSLQDVYGDRLTKVRRTPKHTYILLIGDKRTNGQNRNVLNPFALAYPKRRQPLENEGPTFQVGDEGAVMRPGGST